MPQNVDGEVLIKGVALNTSGLSAYDLSDDNLTLETIQMTGLDGLSLNTRGMLWSIYGIWSDCNENVTTVWSDCS